MKRFAWFILIGTLFCVGSLSFASGLDKVCGDEDQTIFKLSGNTNAHGELWNGSNYAMGDVCFNHIFWGSYLGTNPHQCDGTNTILRFSAETNAHAEAKGGTTTSYFNVCYGDLNCTIISSGNCSQFGTDWSSIVSLSDTTNAHLSFGLIYEKTVCCESTSGIDSRCNYNGICEPGIGESEEYCIDCASVCGDGQITGLEICDVNGAGAGDDVLGGKTCVSASSGDYLSGNLSCMDACLGFDFSQCIGPVCGDGNISGSEECEPPGAANNRTCSLSGGYEGIQFCDEFGPNDCRWDACQSSEESGECGDGIVNGDEDCDYDSGGDHVYKSSEDTCEEVNEDFRGGNLSCSSDCKFNTTQCIGSIGFCQDYQPFFYESGGASFAPVNCYEYNLIYNKSDESWEREELCLQDCVPGASDRVNNGYAGTALSEWGCGWNPEGWWDDNGECYFYFKTDDGSVCRTDYSIVEECGSDTAFQTVELIATPIEGQGPCDAGCGSNNCTTQMPCAKVTQLPFFGIGPFLLSLIAISVIYAIYLAKKK